jgi:site-specific DNA recombinase
VVRRHISAWPGRQAAEAELAKIDTRLKKLVDAIAQDVPVRTLAAEIGRLESRQDELRAKLADPAAPRVFLSPNMAALYKERVAGLHEALAAPERSQEAFEAIRTLIERVVLTPVNGKLTVDLHGQIAAILRLASGKLPNDPLGPDGEQLVMVAGAGFDRDLKCHC